MTATPFTQLQAALGSAYTLERELGGGGMSRVFVALEERLGRRVVVKVLRPELAGDVSAERFEREIRVAAQLQDPRIVPLLSAGGAGGTPFYTMPLIEGESLRSRMDRGPVPLTEAISILRDIALALEYAHARHLVHRDIKPENILLSRRTAMVADFGVAKALAESRRSADGRGNANLSTLTQPGTVVGTPAYLAPEQAAGDKVDHRADLYAWGVVAWELLAGIHPYAGQTTAHAMVAAHIAEPAPPLAPRRPGLPPGLIGIVERALAKDPEDRPRDAAEVVRALESIAGAGDSRSTGWWLPTLHGAGSKWWIAAALVTALLVMAVFWRQRSQRAESLPMGSAPRAVAVLSFVNASGDTADTYLAEGMADELTTALVRVPGVRVAARSSTARFRAAAASAVEVGRALGVDAILEGTVRRSGERLRLTATLTGVSDGIVIWSQRFDRAERDVFDLQDEISSAIVTALLGTLRGSATAPVAAAPRGTADFEAYDLYLKGRFFLAKRGEAGLRKAIEFFQQAVGRDSNFARGWAGLAMAYPVLPIFSSAIPTDSALALAERSAARALALDSTLAEAHLGLANALKMRWRWQDSERHFRSALTLAPEDPAAHHWYGVLLYALGRPDESVRELRVARGLDPFSSVIGSDLSIALYAAGRLEEARREIRHAIELDTTASDAPFILGLVLLAQGFPDSALGAFETAQRLGTGFDLRGYRTLAFHRLGRPREADSAFRELRSAYEGRRALPYDLAIGALAAGERATALSALEETMRQRHMFVSEISLPCDPLWAPLKSEPRFRDLLTRAGMRICSPAAGS